jgi:hypothetical protein
VKQADCAPVIIFVFHLTEELIIILFNYAEYLMYDISFVCFHWLLLIWAAHKGVTENDSQSVLLVNMALCALKYVK